MGDTSYTGDTSTYTTQYIWINKTSSSDYYYYSVSEKKKEKEFIEENEFRV